MKMFHKVLAIILTVLLLVTALPLSAIADAWFEVDAETNGSSSTVTITVDGGALADILQENGISVDLIRDLWDQKAIDLDALKQLITTEEIFELIPHDAWVDLIKTEVDNVIHTIGFDALESYMDIDAVMATADAAGLAALLAAVEDLEQDLEVKKLVDKGYVSKSLLLKHTDRAALLAKMDLDVLKADLAAKTPEQISGMLNLPAVIEFSIKSFLDSDPSMSEGDLLLSGIIVDKDEMLTDLEELRSTDSKTFNGYANDAEIEAFVAEMEQAHPGYEVMFKTTYWVDGAWDLAALCVGGSMEAAIGLGFVDVVGMFRDGELSASDLLTVTPEQIKAGVQSWTMADFEKFLILNNDTLDMIVKAVGGMGEALGCVDIPKLVDELDLHAMIEKIHANGEVLDTYIHFDTLIDHVSFQALLEVVDLEVLVAQFDRDEIIDILKKVDLTSMIKPVVTTVFNKLMFNIDKVTLNGYEVAAENASTKVLSLNSKNLVKAVLTAIPTIDEFVNMKDGKLITLDLGLVYTVDGTTTQKTKNLTVEFVVEGDLSRLQDAIVAAEELIKSYINKLEFANGVLTLDVTLPGTAAKLFATVLDSEEIPEELKQKILNIANVEGNGTLAFVDALTLEELLTIVDLIEPSELFETFKNIGYVQTALEVVADKTGYDLSDLTLDDLVDYATRVPSFERISQIIANKTGVDVMKYVDTIAGKVDSIVDRAEKIGAVQKILDKVSAKFNIDLSEISAEAIVDRVKDKPISETIGNVIETKLGVDILAILETYTVDELFDKALEKAADYEKLYNKVRNYIQLVAAYLPEEFLNGTLAETYQLNGVFAEKGTTTVNAKAFVEKLLRKVTDRVNLPEKAINFILENVRAGEIELGLDLTVRTTDIYRITYMNREGNRVLYEVFLPVGADLSIFKNDSEISGYEFTGWTDENGVEVLTMPAADTVVYADRNVIHVYFNDVNGDLLGMIPMQTGDTLADHADKVAEILGLVTIPSFNPHVIDRYDVSWNVMKEGETPYAITDETQLTADTTLQAALTPDYHFEFDIDVPYEVTEDNGVYTLTILGDLPEFFELNLANDVFLKRANGADDVTLNVVIENGGYTFLTLKDATLAQIYNAQGGDVVFDYAKAATAPESFQNSAYATAVDTAFYSFDILSNGAKVTESFAAPIRIQVPFAAAIENAAGSATRVHTGTAGARELITSTGVVAQGTEKYVWFDAPHFSDYVIATEYLVTVIFTDGTNPIDGAMVGVDPTDMYLPAGHKLILNFTVEAGYSIDKIEALVAGNTTEYNLLDEFVITDAVTFTVTATTGGFNVYYYVNGKLVVDGQGNPVVTPHTKADIASFTTAEAFLAPFATLTAGATVPAGYQNTGAWVGFDQNLIGVSDIYVSAKWNPIVYTVEFKGATSFQVTVENYASIVVEPAVPEKAGEYGAWEAYDLSKLTEKANASNVYTINATYQKLTYDVIVDGNVTAAPTTAIAGETITLTVTQKTGYKALLTVKTDKGADVTVTNDQFTMPAANVYVTVTYAALPMSYTINGVAGSGSYGDSITFEVKLPAGYVLTQAPNASLVAVASANGERTLTYTFMLVEDGTVITYDTAEAYTSLFKIFNGSLFKGSGDPVSAEKNVTFKSWSAAVAGMFSFASFTVTYTQSFLWLWILIAVLVLIAIIAILYALYINGKIRRPLFLLRFIAWLVGLFFALCLAVSGLFLKVLHLFGKSDDPEDYGFDKVDAEDEKVEDTDEAVDADDAAAAAAVAEAATEEATEETAEVVEETAEATEEAAEVVEETAEATEEAAEVVEETAEATEEAVEVVEETAEATEETAEVVEETAEATEETAEVVEETPEEKPEDGATDEDAPADGKTKKD